MYGKVLFELLKKEITGAGVVSHPLGIDMLKQCVQSAVSLISLSNGRVVQMDCHDNVTVTVRKTYNDGETARERKSQSSKQMI